MVATAFAQTRMLRVYGTPIGIGFGSLIIGLFGRVFYLDVFRIGSAQREFVAVDTKLQRVAERRTFDEFDRHTRQNAHIKKMLAQCPFAADRSDNGPPAFFERIERRHIATTRMLAGHVLPWTSLSYRDANRSMRPARAA